MEKTEIFISSVQKEFSEERRAIKDFVEGDPLLRRFFNVFLFEGLPASDRRVDEVYLQEVDRCLIYVGILGSDYGFEDTESLSPTEKEFDRATLRGKERLIFITGKDSERHKKMQGLINKAGNQLIRRRFIGTADLNAELYASLVEFMERTGVLHTLPFDAAACYGASLEDISEEKLSIFIRRARAERGYPLESDTPVLTALTHLNLLDRGQPGNAAILLFGKQPQRFLITSEVKCAHFHSTEVRKPIPSYQIYKGTVFDMVDQAVDFVMSKLARRVGTRELSNQAPVDYEIPRDAVSEAVVNSVAHRDYTSNASVQVMLFSDRLEVWNPGQLPATLTIEKLSRPHPSIPKNPLIADPLFLTRYIEKAGTGILDMIGKCLDAGLPAPEFRQDGGIFIQTLWRPPVEQAATLPMTGQITAQITAQVTAQVTALVGFFCQEPKSAKEIMNELGLKHWKTFQINYLQPLIKVEFLERSIPDKPTSRLQKYRLTLKGKAFLNQLENKAGSIK